MTTLSIHQRINLAPAQTCHDALAEDPWAFDAIPGYGPGSSQDDSVPGFAPTNAIARPGQLPEAYRSMNDEELHRRIRQAKATLADKLVILGHFYQRDEVVQHADFVGDSFQLANAALTRPQAEAIVFCGVHFMGSS